MKKEAAEVEMYELIPTDLQEVERQAELSANGHQPLELVEDETQQNSGNLTEQPEQKVAEPEELIEPPKPTKPRRRIPMRQIVKRFAGCHRCSFFFGGYQAQYSTKDELDAAISDAESGYLNFEWNSEVRTLLCKSFGIQLDVDFYYYEGQCEVCCRRFVFKTGETPDDKPTLTIGL